MTETKRIRDSVVPVHAQADQAVDIHWRLPDGKVLVDRRHVPLRQVTKAGRPKGPTIKGAP
ncbi:MAG: hypothetical protein V4597_08260 [Pseudomonadota bacterium]